MPAQLVEKQRIELHEVNELHDRARGRLDEAQEVAKKLQVAPRTATFGGVWQGLSWATEDGAPIPELNGKSFSALLNSPRKRPRASPSSCPCSASSRGGAKWLQGKSRSTGGAEMLPTAHWLLTAFPFAWLDRTANACFAHRHAAWHDVKTGQVHIPLANESRSSGIRRSQYDAIGAGRAWF